MIEQEKTTVEKMILVIGFIMIVLLSIMVTFELMNDKHDEQLKQVDKKLQKIVEFMRCER